jgi:hypothetical protein
MKSLEERKKELERRLEIIKARQDKKAADEKIRALKKQK